MDPIIWLDKALKVLTHDKPSTIRDDHVDSIPLMKANYAGEIAAQGLYLGALVCERDPKLVQFYQHAMEEEFSHLDLCGERLSQLGSRPSYLNPLWFMGAFCMGALSQIGGSGYALGFVHETEKQVLSHLKSHLKRLSKHDEISRNIIETMIEEEAMHADEAIALGGKPLPKWIQHGMKNCGKLLTELSERS